MYESGVHQSVIEDINDSSVGLIARAFMRELGFDDDVLLLDLDDRILATTIIAVEYGHWGHVYLIGNKVVALKPLISNRDELAYFFELAVKIRDLYS